MTDALCPNDESLTILLEFDKRTQCILVKNPLPPSLAQSSIDTTVFITYIRKHAIYSKMSLFATQRTRISVVPFLVLRCLQLSSKDLSVSTDFSRKPVTGCRSIWWTMCRKLNSMAFGSMSNIFAESRVQSAGPISVKAG